VQYDAFSIIQVIYFSITGLSETVRAPAIVPRFRIASSQQLFWHLLLTVLPDLLTKTYFLDLEDKQL
jgi:hypothetical protein